MRQTQKKSIIAAALLAMLTTAVGCTVYDDHDRYRSGRYDRSSRLDLDRDGRVEQWERNRLDRDRDGRVERWERDRASYPYYGRDEWRSDRYGDSRYRDRFDR
jgi:hypothetical protein